MEKAMELTDEQLAKKLEAEKDSGDESPIDVDIEADKSAKRNSLVSLRFSEDEVTAISKMAKKRGMNVSELIRQAVSDSMSGHQTKNVSIGPVSFTTSGQVIYPLMLYNELRSDIDTEVEQLANVGF